MAAASGLVPPASPPPCFSWRMRFFLGFLLFDIIGHSFLSLAPYRDWLEERKLKNFPKALPTQAQIKHLLEGNEEESLGDRLLETADSVWDFYKPWPERTVRDSLTTSNDVIMYSVSWIVSRLDGLESALNIPQRWVMFSPNASRSATVARFRLKYADGSTKVIRLTADPEDLTNYGHWFEEKILDAELKVPSDWDSRVGYCNFLAHQHARSESGAGLAAIYVYKIRYEYPVPGENIAEKLQKQNGPPEWDKNGPFFVYDPSDKSGRRLASEEARTIQAGLFREKQ